MMKSACILGLVLCDALLVLLTSGCDSVPFFIGEVLAMLCISVICYTIIRIIGSQTKCGLPFWLQALLTMLLTVVTYLCAG